jgi:hypothetical protein
MVGGAIFANAHLLAPLQDEYVPPRTTLDALSKLSTIVFNGRHRDGRQYNGHNDRAD